MPSIALPSKPQAPIAYDLTGPADAKTLVVFINGLGLPAASWKPVIALLQPLLGSSRTAFLAYDRFGHGATTARDPLDEQPGKEPGYGHDLMDAVKDLHELLQNVVPAGAKPRLVFVAASIGAPLARLYAAEHGRSVSGLLVLDSNVANQEATDLWPDPAAAGFKVEEVTADDCTLEQYREARFRISKMFNSDVKNPEGLDRRNLKTLLSEPGKPRLEGPDGKGLYLTVVGHDPERFAEEGLERMQMPLSLSRRFMNP